MVLSGIKLFSILIFIIIQNINCTKYSVKGIKDAKEKNEMKKLLKAQLPNTCKIGLVEPIWEDDEITETYCRCQNGGYGYTCLENFANPCTPGGQIYNKPDPSVPKNYFIECTGEIPYLMKCAKGTKWNQRILTCDWDTSDAYSKSYSAGSYTLSNSYANNNYGANVQDITTSKNQISTDQSNYNNNYGSNYAIPIVTESSLTISTTTAPTAAYNYGQSLYTTQGSNYNNEANQNSNYGNAKLQDIVTNNPSLINNKVQSSINQAANDYTSYGSNSNIGGTLNSQTKGSSDNYQYSNNNQNTQNNNLIASYQNSNYGGSAQSGSILPAKTEYSQSVLNQVLNNNQNFDSLGSSSIYSGSAQQIVVNNPVVSKEYSKSSYSQGSVNSNSNYGGSDSILPVKTEYSKSVSSQGFNNNQNIGSLGSSSSYSGSAQVVVNSPVVSNEYSQSSYTQSSQSNNGYGQSGYGSVTISSPVVSNEFSQSSYNQGSNSVNSVSSNSNYGGSGTITNGKIDILPTLNQGFNNNQNIGSLGSSSSYSGSAQVVVNSPVVSNEYSQSSYTQSSQSNNGYGQSGYGSVTISSPVVSNEFSQSSYNQGSNSVNSVSSNSNYGGSGTITNGKIDILPTLNQGFNNNQNIGSLGSSSSYSGSAQVVVNSPVVSNEYSQSSYSQGSNGLGSLSSNSNYAGSVLQTVTKSSLSQINNGNNYGSLQSTQSFSNQPINSNQNYGQSSVYQNNLNTNSISSPAYDQLSISQGLFNNQNSGSIGSISNIGAFKNSQATLNSYGQSSLNNGLFSNQASNNDQGLNYNSNLNMVTQNFDQNYKQPISNSNTIPISDSNVFQPSLNQAPQYNQVSSYQNSNGGESFQSGSISNQGFINNQKVGSLESSSSYSGSAPVVSNEYSQSSYNQGLNSVSSINSNSNYGGSGSILQQVAVNNPVVSNEYSQSTYNQGSQSNSNYDQSGYGSVTISTPVVSNEFSQSSYNQGSNSVNSVSSNSNYGGSGSILQKVAVNNPVVSNEYSQSSFTQGSLSSNGYGQSGFGPVTKSTPISSEYSQSSYNQGSNSLNSVSSNSNYGGSIQSGFVSVTKNTILAIEPVQSSLNQASNYNNYGNQINRDSVTFTDLVKQPINQGYGSSSYNFNSNSGFQTTTLATTVKIPIIQSANNNQYSQTIENYNSNIAVPTQTTATIISASTANPYVNPIQQLYNQQINKQILQQSNSNNGLANQDYSASTSTTLINNAQSLFSNNQNLYQSIDSSNSNYGAQTFQEATTIKSTTVATYINPIKPTFMIGQQSNNQAVNSNYGTQLNIETNSYNSNNEIKLIPVAKENTNIQPSYNQGSNQQSFSNNNQLKQENLIMPTSTAKVETQGLASGYQTYGSALNAQDNSIKSGSILESNSQQSYGNSQSYGSSYSQDSKVNQVIENTNVNLVKDSKNENLIQPNYYDTTTYVPFTIPHLPVSNQNQQQLFDSKNVASLSTVNSENIYNYLKQALTQNPSINSGYASIVQNKPTASLVNQQQNYLPPSPTVQAPVTLLQPVVKPNINLQPVISQPMVQQQALAPSGKATLLKFLAPQITSSQLNNQQFFKMDIPLEKTGEANCNLPNGVTVGLSLSFF